MGASLRLLCNFFLWCTQCNSGEFKISWGDKRFIRKSHHREDAFRSGNRLSLNAGGLIRNSSREPTVRRGPVKGKDFAGIHAKQVEPFIFVL